MQLTDAEQKAEMQARKTSLASARQRDIFKDTKRELIGWGKSLAGMTGIIAGVTGALNQMNAANDRAAKSLKETRFTGAKLSQVYQDPNERELARQAVENTRSQTGMSREEAQNLQFQLASNGFDYRGADAREFYASLYGTSKDPSKLITGSKKLLAGFGEEEVGDYRRATNKIMVASETSDIDADEMGTAASRVGLSSANIGASDEEALAIIAKLSQAFPSSEEAATAQRALATAIDKLDLGTKGYAEAIRKIEKDPALKDKVFQNVRAKDGFNAYIKSRDEIIALEKRLIEEDALPAGQGAASRVLNNLYDPNTASGRDAIAVREASKAAQRRQIAEERRRGESELQAQAVIDNEMAKSEVAGEGMFRGFGREKFMEAAKFGGVGADGLSTIGDVGAFASGTTLDLLKDVGKMFEQLYQAVTENTEATKEQTKKSANKPMARNNGMVE